MKVIVFVKATEDSEAGIMPSEDLFTAMMAYNEELVNAGVMLAGEGLKPSSCGARVRFSGSSRSVIDGPFTETKELVAGYWLWEVKSLEEAIEWVKKCPNPMPGDSDIEIRPIYTAEDFGDALTPELREQEEQLAQRLAQQESSQTASSHGSLQSPRIEVTSELLVAGYEQNFESSTRHQIPALWEKFAPHIGQIPGQVGMTTYGVCLACNDQGQFDYLAAVQIQNDTEIAAEFRSYRIPAGPYAVFTHSGHVSQISQTIDAIWSRWFPQSGLKVGAAPSFERYTEAFAPATGLGGMEIWIPLKT